MGDRPTAPDRLPNYLAEGIPKQDDESLRAISEWIDNLLAFRHSVRQGDVEVGEDEELDSIQQSDDGTVVVKKVSCGKPNCKCRRGDLHGPYKYVVRRSGEGLEWEYVGPVAE